MGLFDKLKIRVTNKVLQWASSIRGYAPSFSQFGEDIMNDDTVLTIVNRILNEYSKLNPRHIRTVEGKQVKVSDNNINNLLEFPNNLMTKSDFIRKIAFLRETYDNVFIYPSYDLYYNKKTGVTKKVYTGLYPLQPRKVDFYEDESSKIYVEFQLPNGEYSGKILYDEVIHWRKDYGINEYMGGDESGVPNNSALLRHLQLNDKLLQSTFKTVEGSLTINGVLKYGGLINSEEREKSRLDFEKKLKENQSGIIALDSGGDYIPIPFNGKLIDKDTLEFFKKTIMQHYGVSEAILNGDYSNEQKEAFYETVLESGVISLGQAFSRVLLTPFERSNGNTIIFYTNRIQMMNADKKIKLAEVLLPVQGCTPNEIRSWFGEAPIDGGDQTYRFLNWVSSDIANDYQMKTINKNNNASNSEYNNNDDTNNDTIKVGDNNEE
jgi:hypothetical protein